MKIGGYRRWHYGQGIAKAFAQVEGNTVALCDIKQEWARMVWQRSRRATRSWSLRER